MDLKVALCLALPNFQSASSCFRRSLDQLQLHHLHPRTSESLSASLIDLERSLERAIAVVFAIAIAVAVLEPHEELTEPAMAEQASGSQILELMPLKVVWSFLALP